MGIKWWQLLLFTCLVLFVALILHPTKMRKGWMYYQSKDSDKAIEAFSELYEKNPNNYRAIQYLAKSFENVGDHIKAGQFFDKLINKKEKESYFVEAARFYSWTEQPEKEKEIYRKWYKYRIKKDIYFKDNAGKQILNKLYAFYLLDQEYKEAIAILNWQKITDPSEGNQQITNDLISLHEKTGDLWATMTLLENILDNNSEEEFALDRLLVLASFSNKLEKAHKYLIKNITHYADNPKHWQRLIGFETNNKKFIEANNWYEKWVKTYASKGDLKKSYVEWMISTNQQKMAIAFLEKHVKTTDENDYFYQTLVQLYEWNNVKDKLIPIYLARFKKDPENEDNNKKLLWMLLDIKAYHTAYNVLTKLIHKYPHNQEYVLLMVEMYDRDGKEDKANDLLASTAWQSKNYSLLKMLGERYFWINKLEKALKVFTYLEENNASDPDILKYLGDIYFTQNRTLKAEKYMQIYATKRPKDYYPHYRLAELYRSQNRKAISQSYYNKALTLISDQETDFLILTTKARILTLLDQHDKADQLFMTLLKKDPKSIELMTAYIDTLADVNRAEKAYSLVKRYLKEYPDNYALLKSKARIHNLRFEYYKAEKILKKLLKQTPLDLSVKTELAYLYSTMKEYFSALPLFEELRDHYPENTELQKTHDDIFKLTHPYLAAGVRWVRMGNDDSVEPYFLYHHPLSNAWWFEFEYGLNLDKANVVNFDSDFAIYANTVKTTANFRPNPLFDLTAIATHKIVDAQYTLSGHLIGNWEHPKLGRFNVDLFVTERLTLPASVVYFDTNKSGFQITYEKAIATKAFVSAQYTSNWYAVDSNKTDTDMGDLFGREDVVRLSADLIVNRKPEIRFGYDFTYQKFHEINEYSHLIPLIEESARNEFSIELYHDWTDKWRTEARAYVGHDHLRNLSIFGLDLYGFSFTNRYIVSKKFEILGYYGFANESLQLTSGQYQEFFVQTLYRF